MDPLIYNTDKFFSFSDAPITKCTINARTLSFEFEFVYCFLNNNGIPAIYSSEGKPKLVIYFEKILNWTNWETKEKYTGNFDQHLSSLIGADFLAFSHKDNIGKIMYDFGEIDFEFEYFQIIVVPENLFLYRPLTKEEMIQYPASELPSTYLPVSFH